METTLYGPTVGQIVANSWLYWQPALLPGGLWQHFSSIPTFLLPQLLQCRLSEVNIEEVTLKLLSYVLQPLGWTIYIKTLGHVAKLKMMSGTFGSNEYLLTGQTALIM